MGSRHERALPETRRPSRRRQKAAEGAPMSEGAKQVINNVTIGYVPTVRQQLAGLNGRYLPGHPGGPGRPRGSVNVTKVLDAFWEAFDSPDLGGVQGLVEWARESPDHRALFYQMITGLQKLVLLRPDALKAGRAAEVAEQRARLEGALTALLSEMSEEARTFDAEAEAAAE